MYSPQAQAIARFGGVLLAFSIWLPFFAISFAGYNALTFRLWTLDKGAWAVVAGFSVFALAQVRLADRKTTSTIYLIVGGLFTAALVYKLWISPPGSAPIGAVDGKQSVTLNGKSQAVSSVSTRELLEAMGIHQKATYGAYIATIGAAFVTVAAFLEWRSSDAAPAPQAYDPQAQFANSPDYAPQQAAYAPQTYAPPPVPAAPAPAAPTPPQPATAAPSVPPDPFAPPATAAPAAPVQPQMPPPAPPGPPARPPGS